MLAEVNQLREKKESVGSCSESFSSFFGELVFLHLITQGDAGTQGRGVIEIAQIFGSSATFSIILF